MPRVVAAMLCGTLIWVYPKASRQNKLFSVGCHFGARL